MDFNIVDSEIVVQFDTQFFWNITHLVERKAWFFPKPFINLFGPEIFFVHLDKMFLQSGQAKAADIYFIFCCIHVAKVLNLKNYLF